MARQEAGSLWPGRAAHLLSLPSDYLATIAALMCVIYSKQGSDVKAIFIHVPKNGGKHIRRTLKADEGVRIERTMWCVTRGDDHAPTPFMHLYRLRDGIQE